MAQYVLYYYVLIAAPLHKLTRKGEIFPTGFKWIPGSDYNLVYHHVKSLMLDRPLYIWNKDKERHNFLEVDACDNGWEACIYQHADKAPPNEDEDKFFLLSKKPKRIIAWVSKAWTTYEKKSQLVFYKETIACILACVRTLPQPYRDSGPRSWGNVLFRSLTGNQRHFPEQQRKALNLMEASRNL
jgi:hypothetical protein